MSDTGWLARSNAEVLDWGERHVKRREEDIRAGVFPDVTGIGPASEVAQKLDLVAAYDCSVSLEEVGAEAADLIRRQDDEIDHLRAAFLSAMRILNTYHHSRYTNPYPSLDEHYLRVEAMEKALK